MLLDFPDTFSFIDAPDEAIAALESVVTAIMSRPRRLSFNQRDTVHVDLCAASVLNALVRDARKQYRVECGGQLPEDPEANEIIRATGLPRLLKALPAEGDPTDFLHFELREGKKNAPGSRRPSDRNKLSTVFTQYVNDCLARFGFSLSEDGAEYLSSLTAEVIDNAEQHSGSNRWWLAGYLRARPGADFGDCHLVIFNLGLSLAESLKTLPKDAALRAGIERLVAKHQKRFLRPDLRWTEDDLWTLYALQQGVSQKNRQKVGERLGDRGQGTVQMITLFQRLGQRKGGGERPAMAVVSGRTYIRFDGEYVMAPVIEADGQVRKTIAFNKSNSLDEPPDNSCVHALERCFPGTVISLRFFLDKAHLLEVQHASSN